jgi:hypothetical protein
MRSIGTPRMADDAEAVNDEAVSWSAGDVAAAPRRVAPGRGAHTSGCPPVEPNVA